MPISRALTSLSVVELRGRRFIMSDSAFSYASEMAGNYDTIPEKSLFEKNIDPTHPRKQVLEKYSKDVSVLNQGKRLSWLSFC